MVRALVRAASALMPTPVSSGNAIDLRRQHEVALSQPVNLMRENRHFRLAPRKQNIGVMALLLRDPARAIHKIDGLTESDFVLAAKINQV